MQHRPLDDTGSAAPWVVLAVLLVVPVLLLAGWWAVARADNPTHAAAPVRPLLVPVTHQDVRAQTTVSVTVGDLPGREASTAATGTVTAAPQPGAVLDNGVVVLRVNDKPVRAFVSTTPPWRALAPGDKGPDVTRLQQYLSALGYDTGRPSETFGAGLRRAVVRFNQDAGLGKDVATFDPATVVWVGPEPLTVAESLVTEGGPLGPGTPVLRGPARPGAVAVSEPQGGIATLGDFGAQAQLIVGEAKVGYVPGSGSISAPADVAALRAALAPASQGTAQVTATVAQPVATVPASALVQGANGTLCVYEDPQATPVTVTPVGGGVGALDLPADFPLSSVLSNPGRVSLDVACGS